MVVDILVAIALIYVATAMLITKGGIRVNFTVVHKYDAVPAQTETYSGPTSKYADEPAEGEEEFLASAKSLVGSLNEMLFGAIEKKKEGGQ